MRLDPNALAAAAVKPDLAALDGASVLVTGASGLIGSAFAELLLATAAGGRRIDIFLAGRSEAALRARFAGSSAPWSFEPHDVTRPWRGSRAFDFILHAAAPAHPASISAKPADTLRAIVSGTDDILRHAAATGTRRVLFVSSSEIYGKIPGKAAPWREDELGFVPSLCPRSCYPQGKRAAETLCSAMAAQTGLDAVIARPGHVYGPTQTPADSRAHAQFARAAVRGEPIIMKSDGRQPRSYLHALDAATALAALFARGTSGEAYNLASSEISTIRQMAEAFAKAGSVPLLFDLPTEAESRSFNPMPLSALDGSKLGALGWAPAYSMAVGAVDTVTRMKDSLG